MSHELSNFVFAVVAGLVAMALGRALRWLIEKIVDSELITEIIFYSLFLPLAITGSVVVYYGGHLLFHVVAPSVGEYRFMLSAFLLFLVTGYLMYYLRLRQHGKQFRVEVPRDKAPHHIPVSLLHDRGLKPDQQLDLTYNTFAAGIESLLKQIATHSPRIVPDLWVGINAGGMAIAAALSEKLGGKKNLGVIQTHGDENHKVHPRKVALPDVENVGTILVVDNEVKSGRSIRHVVDFLREKYDRDKLTIKVAVLVASEVTGPIKHIWELAQGLQGVFEEDRKCFPHFLAFVSRNKVSTLP